MIQVLVLLVHNRALHYYITISFNLPLAAGGSIVPFQRLTSKHSYAGLNISPSSDVWDIS